MTQPKVDFEKMDGLVCHEGKVSCFTKPLPFANAVEVKRG